MKTYTVIITYKEKGKNKVRNFDNVDSVNVNNSEILLHFTNKTTYHYKYTHLSTIQIVDNRILYK